MWFQHCLGVFGHQFLQFISVSAHQIGNLSTKFTSNLFVPLQIGIKNIYPLTIFDENEGRHGRDLIMNGNVFSLINVDFKEFDVAHLSFHFLKHWWDHLARTTPSGKEINDDQLVSGLFELGLKVRHRSTFVYHDEFCNFEKPSVIFFPGFLINNFQSNRKSLNLWCNFCLRMNFKKNFVRLYSRIFDYRRIARTFRNSLKLEKTYQINQFVITKKPCQCVKD